MAASTPASSSATPRSGAGATSPHALDALLASREMVLVTGSGGVGKTTVSAALAVAAVTHQNCRVLVLTVDPARRLADALGVGAFGNQAVRIPDDAFSGLPRKPKGELWAAMLDTKRLMRGSLRPWGLSSSSSGLGFSVASAAPHQGAQAWWVHNSAPACI